MKHARLLLLLLIIVFACNSCNRNKRQGLPFGDMKGIHYTEVRRIFNTGLVFDKQGYQLAPVWRFYFVSDDSVQVFSPKKQRYYGFHIYYDHDLIFNMVDSWLQMLKLTPDSILFRTLRVNEKREILLDDEGSNVYMTFYSDAYLKKKKAEVVKRMGLPSAKDTAYIKTRSALANRVLDSAFSAREPVIMKSTSLFVQAERVVKQEDPLSDMDPAEDYLYPEYNITIHHAYEDFGYSISAFVDEKGGVYFRKSQIPYSHEFETTYDKIIKSIIAGYVARYVNVTPGTTLGIPHTSIIVLNLTGKKN
jgi:hypothetical protein